MRKMYIATPYASCNLGAFGKARHMYLRQYQFPDTFDESDELASVDSYRLDPEHLMSCFRKHTNVRSEIGQFKFEEWVLNATDKQIFSMLKDVHKVEGEHWTGYRIMASIRPGGFVMWHFQLFAKSDQSATVVYTGPIAPNVKI